MPSEPHDALACQVAERRPHGGAAPTHAHGRLAEVTRIVKRQRP
jgi:hypothetical protein